MDPFCNQCRINVLESMEAGRNAHLYENQSKTCRMPHRAGSARALFFCQFIDDLAGYYQVCLGKRSLL